jgi:hypothetical protein
MINQQPNIAGIIISAIMPQLSGLAIPGFYTWIIQCIPGFFL